MGHLAVALLIVGFHSLLLCRRHLSTFPGIGTESKALPVSGPIQLKHELHIRISHDFALLVVAFLPSFSLAFLVVGVAIISYRMFGTRKLTSLNKAFFAIGVNVITDLGTVGHQLASTAYHHLLFLLFAAAVTLGFLSVEPVVSVGIIVELDELIELAWEDLESVS